MESTLLTTISYVILCSNYIFKTSEMLKSIFKNVASTHRRVLCVSNACDICSVEQRQNSLLLPLQTSSAQRMRAIVSLSWHTWPRSHKEWGSSWHGRDEERRRTARATRACLALPGRFSLLRSIQGCGNISILASKDESSIPQGLASRQRRVKLQINARAEWSQEPTRYSCDFLHRTGEASPELDPPMSPQMGSVKTEKSVFKNQVFGEINMLLHLNVRYEHILTVIRTQWASSSWPLAPTRALRRFKSFTLTMLMSLSKQNAWIRVKWIWWAMSHSKSSVAKRQKDTLSGSLWKQK